MRNTIDYGIDLGTTNSVLARQDRATTTLIKGPKGEQLLPSALHVDASGLIEVGSDARAKRDADPENTSIEFKRLMGTDEKKVFPASGRAFSPEQLSAEVLKTLTGWVHPEPLNAAVITVPAMFQLPQCEATRRAAELAGIVHAPLLQEPIAAAIAHCGSSNIREGMWLVYDLGGGTFDVSLIRSKGGRLQVMDHDGDNQLGGRDFDRVVMLEAAKKVRADGKLGDFRRSDPRFSDAFARLKLESERLRLKLSVEEEAGFFVENLAAADSGEQISVSLSMARDELEDLLQPLVDRTIALCQKMLSRNRLEGKELKGLVMVGGPTRTPCVPRLLQEALVVEARHVLDPMTIVAQGAAVFASTQKLPASLRLPSSGGANVVNVQLEYEPMTTDPQPLVVGKLDASGAAAKSVRVTREDGFDSGVVAISPKQAFAVPLKLNTGALNRFTLEALDATGAGLPTSPSEFAILHGLSVAKPPLSQSVGIMLSNNSVAWYLRKGVVLPARHTMTHATTVELKRGQSGDAVNVPVLQGESDRADRNKVIGVLRIHAEKIGRDLPAGTDVEVHVTVDESSHTTARAYVPLLGQWFDEVVMFRMESKESNQVTKSLEDQRKRLSELENLAEELEAEGGTVDERVAEIESLLEEGDRDSIDMADQLVRRMTQEIDKAESETRRESVEKEFADMYSDAERLLGSLGTDSEKRQMKALSDEFRKALAKGDVVAAEARKESLRELLIRVWMRTPSYWKHTFERFAARITALGLASKAAQWISLGRRGAANDSINELQQACRELWALLPTDDSEKANAPTELTSHLR